jgi:hypothetical protein
MKRLLMLAFLALTILAANPIHTGNNPYPDCSPCDSLR